MFIEMQPLKERGHNPHSFGHFALVSVYRTMSVRTVPLLYHRCHCWRRHQRHQRPISRRSLWRPFGDKINRFKSHKNARLPRNMSVKWRQISATTTNIIYASSLPGWRRLCSRFETLANGTDDNGYINAQKEIKYPTDKELKMFWQTPVT